MSAPTHCDYVPLLLLLLLLLLLPLCYVLPLLLPLFQGYLSNTRGDELPHQVSATS